MNIKQLIAYVALMHSDRVKLLKLVSTAADVLLQYPRDQQAVKALARIRATLEQLTAKSDEAAQIFGQRDEGETTT